MFKIFSQTTAVGHHHNTAAVVDLQYEFRELNGTI